MTVPPLGGGQDRAALAAGHVDADDGDVGRAAGGRPRRRAARPGRGRRRRRPSSASRRCRAAGRPRASVRARRRWCGGRRRRGPRPGTASRTCRRRRSRRPTGPRRTAATTPALGQRRGAADVHHRQRRARVGGRRGARRRSSGRTGSRSRRPAPARCGRPSASRPSSITSGVRVSETSVATRSPTARPSGDSGPTSSTVPTSMPPEPVTGFCILPRLGDDLEHLARARRRRPPPSPVCASSCRNDAASRLSRSTRDPHLVGPELAAGVEPLRPPAAARPAGSSTRCRPIGSPTACDRCQRCTGILRRIVMTKNLRSALD